MFYHISKQISKIKEGKRQRRIDAIEKIAENEAYILERVKIAKERGKERAKFKAEKL